jgi:hypothetical protein
MSSPVPVLSVFEVKSDAVEFATEFADNSDRIPDSESLAKLLLKPLSSKFSSWASRRAFPANSGAGNGW